MPGVNIDVCMRRADEPQERIFSAYPMFFRAAHYPQAYPSNLANLGIRCGAGWYSIIEQAAHEIERELQAIWVALMRTPAGLASIDRDLLTEANEVEYPVIPFCSDIYEAAGELRISVLDGYLCEPVAWSRIRESIQNAVRRARTTCERCGEPGELREIYWHHVYCDDCIAHMDFKERDPSER